MVQRVRVLLAALLAVLGVQAAIDTAVNLAPQDAGELRPLVASSDSCSVPRPDSSGDRLPTCPPNPPSSLDEAILNGYRYAPVVKFHPLETYFMESPDAWYASSRGYPAPGNGLRKPFRSKYGAEVSLLDASKLAENADTAFDANGESTATVYFTVQEYAEDFWLYNYQLFFPWNGCSSQEYAVANSGYLSYQMCPAGVHECDLEIVSLLVCKSDLVNGAKRIGYNQHGWSEIRNCDDAARGCPKDADGHPIVYAALGGHALYPENDAPFHVYYHTPNLPIYVGDRTADGGKTFTPTQQNVKFLPIIDGLPEDAVWEWARFNGNWGRIFGGTPETTVRCFSDDGLKLDDCVTADPARAGIAEIVKAGAALTSESRPAQDQFMNGPLQRSATYQILGNKLPPILENAAAFPEYVLQCPKDVARLGDAVDTNVDPNASIEIPVTAAAPLGSESPSGMVVTPIATSSGASGLGCTPATTAVHVLFFFVMIRNILQ